LEAIDQIRKYASKGRKAFDRDELIQVWIVHHLARIGEATARLSPKLRRQSGVPWKEIIGMRNILVHEYFRIDPEIIWAAVEMQLRALEQRARSILAEIEKH
jgi:uncharacterized protein with HEPN domain